MVHEYIIAITKLILVKHYYRFQGKGIQTILFFFLSSLFKNEVENVDFYSSTTRAICYNLFCSEKSLTIQINDDYIVCPRAG